MACTRGEHPSHEHQPGWETAGWHCAHGVVACTHALAGSSLVASRTFASISLTLNTTFFAYNVRIWMHEHHAPSPTDNTSGRSTGRYMLVHCCLPTSQKH